MSTLLPEYDMFLWVDARLQLRVDPNFLVSRYLHSNDKGLATFKHPRNTTLQDELNELYVEELITSQEKAELESRLGPSALSYGPMPETNLLLHPNTAGLHEFTQHWWEAFESTLPRDQVAFGMAALGSDIEYIFLDQGQSDASNSDYVIKGKHRLTRARVLKRGLKEIGAGPSRGFTNSKNRLTPQSSSLTLLVPVHNNSQAVDRLVTSLEDTTSTLDVLVVDNGSERSESEKIQQSLERSHHAIRYARYKDALGFSGAVNEGFRHITTEFFLLANSDVQLPPMKLDVLWKEIAMSSLAILGFIGNHAGDQSVLRDEVNSLIESGADSQQLLREINAFCQGWTEGLSPTLSRSVHGSLMLIRSTAFRLLKGFDQAAFPLGYGEEVDLCIRAQRLGLHAGISTSHYYLHDGAGTFGPEQRARLNLSGREVLEASYPWFPWRTVSRELRSNPRLRSVEADLRRALPYLVPGLD